MALAFVFVVFMGIGYSYLNRNLNVKGNLTIKKSTWDVHFDNFSVSDGSVRGDYSYSSNNTKLDLSVLFVDPGDIYEFTVDVVNGGTIDAMVSSVSGLTLTSDQSEYLEYSVTYKNGSSIGVNDILKSNTSESFKVVIKYKEGVTAPLDEKEFSLVFNPSYVQADGSARGLLYSMIRNNSVLDNTTSEFVTSSTGIDFSNVSSDTNGKGVYLLSSTKDDSKPVYYYRGAVTNNNVKFANFCWKIVRTTETGGIKLVYNGVPSASGACDNTGAASVIGTGTFNKNNNDNAYVGYMYGTAGASTYAETHKNTNDSTIKTVIDTWYKNNLLDYTEKLEDDVWCNDRSFDSGTGIATTTTYYSGYGRLNTSKIPSLECKNQNDKFTVNTANGNGNLTYPISMLTADEVVYSGGTMSTTNNTYYLYTGQSYWTLTSSYYYSANNYAREIRVNSTGTVAVGTVVSDNSLAIRPSISLKSGTKILSGDGSVNSPYIVE